MQRRTASSLVLLALWALGAAAQPRSGRPSAAAGPDIEVAEQRGCGPGPYLKPNMQNCAIDEMMGSNATMTFGFKIDPKAARKHGVLLTLRSVGGAAVMRVLPPGAGLYNGRVVYFNDAVTESILRVPADDLEAGDYTILLQGMGGATQKLLVYLRVQTPPANITLAPKERAAMQAIWRSCCPVTKGLEAPDVCATFLPDALKATKPEDDLCNKMAFMCNAQGQLEKIDFSNAGLKCPRFPPEFGQFPALETLMLRFNSFNEDTFENVAEVLSGAEKLQRLMMGNTNITGRIPCRLFEEHTLKTVMFSVNKLEGELPECVLSHTSLEELYMSRLPLAGSLPDTIPEDSNLVVWYAINRDPITGRPAGEGFTGKLPRTLANAKHLAFAELSGHRLTGDVPVLPPNIRMFEVQNNKLDGPVESPLPASIIYFDVSNNSLIGNVPDFAAAENLTLFDMSMNQLTGELPTSFGKAGDKMVYMDLSKNRIGGDINKGGAWDRVPALQYLFLQGNELKGTIPASLAASPKLVALNMAFNRMNGNLDAFANAIEPPRKNSPQIDPTSMGGRKLAAFSRRPAAAAAVDPAAAAAASLALGKKLLGTREDWSVLQPGQALQQQFTLDTGAIEAMANGEAHAAGRRLMQAVTSTPAAGGATTSTVTRPPVTSPTTPTTTPAAAAAEPEEDPAAAEPAAQPTAPITRPTTTTTTTPTITPTTTPTTTTTSPSRPTTPTTTPTTTSTSTTPAPDTPEEETPGEEPPSTSTPAVEPTPPAAAPSTPSTTRPSTSSRSRAVPIHPAGPPRGRPMPDMAFIAPPTRSQLAGNSFLYLNLSNNEFDGAIPEGLGNLEMFRSPANSTDPFDMFVFSRGGPDRTLDLTYNKFYGQFPRFLVNQAADLSDSCLCATNFTVSAGNQLYCPTKAALEGVKMSANLMESFKQANYTCLLPKQKEPVALEKYLASPEQYLTDVPSQSDLATPEQRPRSIDGTDNGYGSTKRSSGNASRSGGKSGLNAGEIAGIVIGVVAGVAILGALAYFVGYRKLYQAHRATSFKRSDIPDGPAMDGAGAYPAAAYGGGANNGVPVSAGARV